MFNVFFVTDMCRSILGTVCLLLLSFSAFTALSSVSAMIISAYVVPHGGIALDPQNFNTTNATAKKEAWIVHNSFKEIGEEIAHAKPDVVFLSTPHGVADMENFVFYLNSFGQGVADTDNCAPPSCSVNLTANLAYDLAKTMTHKLKEQFKVSGLSAFGPPGKSENFFPLRWGEVIPLHFVPNLNNSEVLILSQPSRRYTEAVSMTQELLKLGGALYEHLEALEQRVVVLISADLAHTHSKDGPYGFSEAAEPFDEACGKWAETLDGNSLLSTAAQYVDKALSCGYTGLVMLHGLMTANQSLSWKPKLFANYHPSYYGMMVAAFTKSNETPSV